MGERYWTTRRKSFRSIEGRRDRREYLEFLLEFVEKGVSTPEFEIASTGGGQLVSLNRQVPLNGSSLWCAGFALGLANFIVVLDSTIANVSVPTIAGALGSSVNQGTWTITSYAVAEAISIPMTSWLVARFGLVRMFVACVSAFGVCSALSGLSPSLESLIV